MLTYLMHPLLSKIYILWNAMQNLNSKKGDMFFPFKENLLKMGMKSDDALFK